MGKHAPVPRRQPGFGRDDLAGLRYHVGFGLTRPVLLVIGRDRLTLVSIVLNPAPAGTKE